ncbi:MAG: dihydrolipoyl dehydrogenase [Burkholderiaceae bacterium]|nr:dihydrolipoyl dehydrogenase [Burkholderiaceae bacterium]
MSERFDVVVIGAGPAGYIASIRAAQLGFKVACAEKWMNPDGEAALGGTCLNVGCIPSKALLASSEEFAKLHEAIGEHGISVENPRVDVSKMLERKNGIVKKMTKGIEFLFRKNRITWLKGHARLAGSADGFHRVEISGESGVEVHEAKNIIIASGSRPRALPGIEIDNKLICDNEGALSFDKVPKRLAVIGAGVIGLELGSVWRRLGSEVTVLEAMPKFLAACDDAVAKEAAKSFAKQGLDIKLGVKIGEIKTSKKGVSIRYEDSSGTAQVLEADRLVVSVGRVPNTHDLGLETVGLALDERGLVPVDDHCRTAVGGVFAIGDVVRGPMLAHKGEDEGVMVAELIAGQSPHIDYNCIPWVIYTSPEIAWVGRTEQQLKSEGRQYKSGQFPFAANGRALGMGHSDGFVKVLSDAQTDEVLGVHVISASASDLISEAALAMEFKASAEDIGRVCHPHPSMSEVMREAALATDKRALNM